MPTTTSSLLVHDLPAVALPDPNAVTDRVTVRSPRTGETLQLTRTALSEAIAWQLMAVIEAAGLTDREGKMFGVLLVRQPDGRRGYLQAFSGLLNGQPEHPGWVPPLPGRERTALVEARTVAELDRIRAELAPLENHLLRREQAERRAHIETEKQQYQAAFVQRRDARRQRRQILEALPPGPERDHQLAELDRESADDSYARMRRWRELRAQLEELETEVADLERRIRSLKQQRKQLSRQLQVQMHDAVDLSDFGGQLTRLTDCFGDRRPPTGTGDCCAPKLLQTAARLGLQPLALAEFWWGPPQGDRQPGQFYPPCAERCQPILGHLLAGLEQQPTLAPVTPTGLDLPIVYEDDWLVVVAKPSGMPTVPGRNSPRHETVIGRLAERYPEAVGCLLVHRLDMDTSGLLVAARTPAAQSFLQRQFREQRARKCYEAVLDGVLSSESGEVDLPLRPDWPRRPLQCVCFERGRPAHTRYRVLEVTGDRTRIEFEPLTGRTHQLRLHAADPRGLGAAIAGDNLYGNPASAPRLLLHARELVLAHPARDAPLELSLPTPF